ncbi:MAG TPA: hypothetical protein VHP32_06760 [Ignavibacteria bacterium]|nr:hypothetical protein [Ignavibacteria bacterium]
MNSTLSALSVITDDEDKTPGNTKNKCGLMKSNDSAWDSGINIIRSVKVIIPLKLLVICNHISRMVDDNEFSIVTDIIKDQSNKIDELRLSEEYYIPKQKVTSCSIDYEADSYDHNVVIHRHPDGLNNFSSTDHSFINQNFELSLLFTQKDGFVNGIYNMKVNEAIIPLPVTPVIDYGIGIIDISNIESKNIFDKDFTFKTEKKNDYGGRKDNFRSSYIDEEDIKWEIMELRGRVDLIEEMMAYETGMTG